MPSARDYSAVAFKNGSLALLARVLGAAGQPIVPADLTAASYTIYRLDETDPDSETPVAGHTAVSLEVASVVFASLQRDANWNVDEVGYNFKHTLDISAQPAFATAGIYYRLRYELVPTSGPPLLVRFKVRVI